ncbi:hypothetical protein [Aquisalibacillus elongatus]|nr:hypothetical protein [Aquisalibacillus elongatus]
MACKKGQDDLREQLGRREGKADYIQHKLMEHDEDIFHLKKRAY